MHQLDSSDSIVAKIHAFIGRNLAPGAVPVALFKLMHVGAEATPLDAVLSSAIVMEPTPGNAITAERFAACAQDHADAQDNGLSQRYDVAALDAKGAIVGRQPFRLTSAKAAQAGYDLAPTEAPDSEGVTALSMRHLESMRKQQLAIQAMLAKEQQSAFMALSEENAKLRAIVQESMEKGLEVSATLQRLQSEEHERRLEQMKEVGREQRQQWLFKQLQDMAPTILQHLTGATPIKKFLKVIDPETLGKIAAALNPEQVSALQEFLAEVGVIGSEPAIAETSTTAAIAEN